VNPRAPSPDAALAPSLANLWPYREHESNAVKSLLCRSGVHRWRRIDLRQLGPDRDVTFCFWCSKIRIDGTLYEP
jgi:hypothetical protein